MAHITPFSRSPSLGLVASHRKICSSQKGHSFLPARMVNQKSRISGNLREGHQLAPLVCFASRLSQPLVWVKGASLRSTGPQAAEELQLQLYTGPGTEAVSSKESITLPGVTLFLWNSKEVRWPDIDTCKDSVS